MSHTSTQRAQALSLLNANRRGQEWTLADLEMLEAFAELPNAELAEALGRTLYAVWTAKHALAGKPRTSRKAQAKPRTRPYGEWRQAWTFLDGDCPPDW